MQVWAGTGRHNGVPWTCHAGQDPARGAPVGFGGLPPFWGAAAPPPSQCEGAQGRLSPLTPEAHFPATGNPWPFWLKFASR